MTTLDQMFCDESSEDDHAPASPQPQDPTPAAPQSRHTIFSTARRHLAPIHLSGEMPLGVIVAAQAAAQAAAQKEKRVSIQETRQSVSPPEKRVSISPPIILRKTSLLSSGRL